MKEFIKSMDDLPLIVKIILAIPGIDIVWSIYRIVKASVLKDSVGVIIWVLLTIFASWNVLAIIDIIMLLLTGKPLYIVFSSSNNDNKEDDVIDVDVK
jgi:hypothetical protein